MLYENFDPLFPDQPVVDLYLPVWASLPAFRSKPAFIWSEDGTAEDALNEGSFLTYRQLHDSVQLISDQLLRGQLLRRRDTVVILCSPGLELVQLIYGCQRAGLVSVPISPPDPRFANEDCHHLARVLEQTKPQAAIAHQAYIATIFRYLSSSPTNEKLALLLQSVKWISMDTLKTPNNDDDQLVSVISNKLDQPNFYHSNSSYYGCKPEEPYLIQYTSGATGVSKPVVVSAGAAAHNVRAARKAYDLNPNSVIVSWLPQYHDCGLMFLLLTVISGATCVLTSPISFVTRPITWLHLITAFKATCTPVPSFTLPLVLKRVKEETDHQVVSTGGAGLDLGSLRNLILINEPIYRSAVEEFVDVFKAVGLDPGCVSPSYGLAENCTFVSTAWSDDGGQRWGFPAMPSYRKLLPCARLRDGSAEIEVVVVNGETREVVDDGVEGEIWVSSPSNASGYLGLPSLTRERFHSKISNKSSPNFVRTGDRGVIKGADRYLFVIGRCSDVIKLNNNQEIHPHYIESIAYNNCSAYLRGGCLAAVKISETIAVVAEMQRADKNDAESLRRICEGIRKAALIEEGIELGLVVLVKRGNVPKTTSGKVKRSAAKEKLTGGGMSVLMAVRFGKTCGDLKDSEGKCSVSDENEEFRTRPLLLSLL